MNDQTVGSDGGGEAENKQQWQPLRQKGENKSEASSSEKTLKNSYRKGSQSFDPDDLTSFDSIKKTTVSEIPKELRSKLKSKWYKAGPFYKIDTPEKWKGYTSQLKKTGAAEKWVFYGCPVSMAEKVFNHSRIYPYEQFFPRLLGESALYFFAKASEAVRTALQFGVEKKGYIISCRINIDNLFQTAAGAPKATAPPKGYDAILASFGTDLGNGPIHSDTYALYDHERVLMRYIIAVEKT